MIFRLTQGLTALALGRSGPVLWLYAPFKSSGAPQLYSTFSIPRCNSPIASRRRGGAPCQLGLARGLDGLLHRAPIRQRDLFFRSACWRIESVLSAFYIYVIFTIDEVTDYGHGIIPRCAPAKLDV